MEQQLQRSVKIYSLRIPAQPTAFIGRASELAEISRLLADPVCRLLTLLGPGGIGKTRLAIQTAMRLLNDFEHGVAFVPLQAIRSTNFLASAIADAIDLPLTGQADPAVQLLNYLRDKEMLLVLDNFEQLLVPPSSSPQAESSGRITLISDMLMAAPRVKLLITSREVLNLQEEWLYPVAGLPFPNAPFLEADTRVEEYSAVRLFAERASRVRRDFSLAEEQAEVVRICQLVEGTPLALELAASWAKTLRCEVIAAEIQRNLDFLVTNLRNVPDRQRSVRAVFEHSWQLLSLEEQSAFKRLAVYREGFQREAAQRIAGASLTTLSALVDKSLLRLEPDGRYQMHELLRQYAAEQLAQTPEDVGRMYDQHCAYYADFLHQRAKEVVGVRQREVIQEFTGELENIRAAWQWAAAQERVADLQKAVYPYSQLCDFQSRYREAADALELAIQSLQNTPLSSQKELTLALLLSFLGWNHIRLGQLENAKTVFEKSWMAFNNLDISPPQEFGADPLNGLALVAHILGNYAEATRLGEEARRRGEARADRLNLQITFYVLANAAFAQGHFETARNYNQLAFGLAQETNNHWFMAYVLVEMGNVARALGDYAQAGQHYQASYTIREEFDDPEGMAVALNHLGKIATLQENYVEAQQLYQQSLAIYQEIYDRGGLAASLAGLGGAARALGNYQAAQQYLQQALQITSEMLFIPLTLSILSQVGQLLLQIGQPERAIELLALVLHHPASDHETKAGAQQLLARCKTMLPIEVYANAALQGTSSELEALIAKVLAVLATPFQAEERTISPAPSHPASSALVEPLTARELEVLQLVAEGLTNQQIAEKLIISVGTAKFYTSQIYAKLNVSSRTQAVARARELNLLA